MKPADLARLDEVSDPRVSPDGRHVSFVVSTPDLGTNRYRTRIWVTGLDAEVPPIPFTDGSARETRPRWSPDGETLAYVTHPDDSGARLVVADIEGEDALEVVEWPEDIEELAWAPDGRTLVFTARLRDEATYGPERERDRPGRRIDRLSYRQDNVGWTVDRHRHVFRVPADGSGPVVRLTSADAEHAGIAVSPDGAWVAFTSTADDPTGCDVISHVYRVPLAGGEIERLTSGRGARTGPSWSADGGAIAFVLGDRESAGRNAQVCVLDVASGEVRALTASLDRNCAPFLMQAREPLWDGDALLFQAEDRGSLPLFRATTDGSVSVAVGGERMVTGFDLAGGTLAFVATTGDRPGDLHVLDGGAERRVTSFGEAFARTVPTATPEPFTVTTADGTEVDAWIVRPPGLEPGARCPVLLNIHGGPFSQYGNRFFDEFQVQAAAGYAVLFSNPRGSSGREEPFGRAIRGPRAADDPGTGWGGVDFDDLMAVVDTALARFDFLDPDRVGVLGGSYGGYMTTWIVGHTTRFRSALSERACNNLFTFAHTSDIGAWFPACYIGASHLDDPDEFARQSPVTYYRDIDTPLLILHSEDDLRCPIEQAEDLFVRLKMTGKTVEFVRFPGSSHELSRSGPPRQRAERLGIILDWFARTL